MLHYSISRFLEGGITDDKQNNKIIKFTSKWYHELSSVSTLIVLTIAGGYKKRPIWWVKKVKK